MAPEGRWGEGEEQCGERFWRDWRRQKWTKDVGQEEAAGDGGSDEAEDPQRRVHGGGEAASGWKQALRWKSMRWKEGLVDRVEAEVGWAGQEVGAHKTADLEAGYLGAREGRRRLSAESRGRCASDLMGAK